MCSRRNFTLVEISTVCSRSWSMYGMLPTRPLSTWLFLMYTLDILYLHHSFPFAIRTTKTAARKTKDVQTQNKYRDSHRDLTKSIIIRFSCANAKLVSRNRPYAALTIRCYLRPVDRVIARKVTRQFLSLRCIIEHSSNLCLNGNDSLKVKALWGRDSCYTFGRFYWWINLMRWKMGFQNTATCQ